MLNKANFPNFVQIIPKMLSNVLDQCRIKTTHYGITEYPRLYIVLNLMFTELMSMAKFLDYPPATSEVGSPNPRRLNF